MADPVITVKLIWTQSADLDATRAAIAVGTSAAATVISANGIDADESLAAGLFGGITPGAGYTATIARINADNDPFVAGTEYFFIIVSGDTDSNWNTDAVVGDAVSVTVTAVTGNGGGGVTIHVATVGLFNVNSITGEVYHRTDPAIPLPIKGALSFNTEHRIFENPLIPNTAGNPTIDDYLVLEGDSGFIPVKTDQTRVITRSL